MKYVQTLLVIGGLLLSPTCYAKLTEYTLNIDKKTVNISGHTAERIAVNGTIPGPILHFTQGDDVVIHVKNNLDKDTSVHWHGILLDGYMDGVPGLNNFHGIKPKETFTYKFHIRQNGTYWYHAHSMGQEQDGNYGSIVIEPKEELAKADRDYVILLSEFHEDDSETIMSNLKKSSEYYVYKRRTLGDFFNNVSKDGFSSAWDDAVMWGDMRMLPTDIADVNNYTFLMNGKTQEQNWTALYKKGEKIKLRFINGSAMSFFDIRIPNVKMTVVAADGQYIEPVVVDEFRIGVAETYDVIVEPLDEKPYSIVAESIDRSGFAVGTLAPKEGMRGITPKHRPMSLLTMADMGMSHDMGGMDHSKMGHDMSSMKGMDHSKMGHDMSSMKGMDHSKMGYDMNHKMNMSEEPDYETGVTGSGWADYGTPKGHKLLTYKDLRFYGEQSDVRKPEKEIIIRLGGNMERYIWTLNGKKYNESDGIYLNYGERVRLKFINDTMMAHPMHLHGMFMQLENGQPIDKLPNKHTIIVAPGDSYSALLTADEAGEWAFHCHLLYHMMSGMMTKVTVSKKGEQVKNSTMNHETMNHNMHEGHHHE